MNEKEVWFLLSSLKDFSRKKINRLIGLAKDTSSLLDLDFSQISDEIITKKDSYNLVKAINNKEKIIYEGFSMLEKNNINFTYYKEDDFPESLFNIEDMPFVLYYKGKLMKEKEVCVSIVGARECSEYGKTITKDFTKDFARYNISVVSGMARGIDTIAHQTALDFGGKTYAILANGLDICYPQENIDLFQEIPKNGAIISEYPLMTKPLPYLFPERNRIISALSEKLLVIEAREKSGTLITVEHALEQGKDIYAVPGRVGDTLSLGCNQLIKSGAGIALKASDVIEDMIYKIDESNNNKINNKKLTLEKDLEVLYSRLDFTPKNLQQLSEEIGCKIDKTLVNILKLQLIGLVYEPTKNYYIKIKNQ